MPSTDQCTYRVYGISQATSAAHRTTSMSLSLSLSIIRGLRFYVHRQNMNENTKRPLDYTCIMHVDETERRRRKSNHASCNMPTAHDDHDDEMTLLTNCTQ